MPATQENTPRSVFRVDVPNPRGIYLLVKNNLPFVYRPGADPRYNKRFTEMNETEFREVMGPDNLIIDETLSDTQLGGPLFSDERTNIVVSWHNSPLSPQVLVRSKAYFLSPRRERENNFYSSQRVGEVQDELLRGGVMARVVPHSVSSTLDIVAANKEVRMEVDFGFSSLQSARQVHLDVIDSLSVLDADKERFRAHSARRPDSDFSNDGVELTYNFPFGEEPDFIARMKFYGHVYEKLIEALHGERKINPPPVAIILESPFHVNTSINFEKPVGS